MRRIDQDDWADLCGQAEGLVWRVLDAGGWAGPGRPNVVHAAFLQHLEVTGQIRWHYVEANAATGERYQVHLVGTDLRLNVYAPVQMAGLVAIAAAMEPRGEHAQEVLALASTMHALGLVEVAS